jgi:uncharacterized protein
VTVWSVFLTGLAAASGGYALLALAIMLLQRRLIYKPDPRRITPAEQGLSGIEVWSIPTPDNCTLTAWYSPAPAGRPTVLYFHGNAGWIELRAERLAALTERGYGVLMPSYRGYGGSTGAPSEAANVADAKLIYDRLRDSGVPASEIIIMGESLGTGVATQLAAAKVAAGLVLDSPYTSMAGLGARDFPWLPVRRLLWDVYDTHRHIRRVTIPVLVLHGEADTLVPCDMGRAVRAAAVAPATLLTYPGAAHLDHLGLGSFDELAAWIVSISQRQTARNSAAAKAPERNKG